MALSERALNRALLARQGLLERFDAPVVDVVEAIGALQAQAWAAPPVALWSRLRGFSADHLYDALARGELVVGTNLRGTLHLVSAREHPAYRAVAEASDLQGWRRTSAERTPESDELRPALLAWAAREPRTGEQVAEFAEAWVAEHPDAIAEDELARQRELKWRPLPRWSSLVRVPANGTWGPKTPAALRAAPGDDMTAEAALPEVVRRHLRAFGPAGADDVASWIGWRTPPVRDALDGLGLVVQEGEDGRALYDVPDAPRPDPDTDAPPRFLAAFDSALLAYASKRRARIVPDALRDLVYLRRNLQVRPTFTVDGRVAGIWAAEVKRREATLTLTVAGRLAAADRRALVAEGERLVRWAEPRATAHRVVVERA